MVHARLHFSGECCRESRVMPIMIVYHVNTTSTLRAGSTARTAVAQRARPFQQRRLPTTRVGWISGKNGSPL